MEKLEMILSVERLSHNRHYSALSCIVLADYAERYYAPLELSPEWGAISQQALADVFVKNHFEQ